MRTVRSPNSPEDASLWRVAEITSICQSTLKIIESIKKGDDVKKLPTDHPGKALTDVRNELGIKNTSQGEVLVVNQKLFIPKGIRRDLLRDLHSTYICAEKMWHTIHGIWMWQVLKQ